MSGRRLRIKGAVNLGTKRKSSTKPSDEVKLEIESEVDDKKFKQEIEVVTVVDTVQESTGTTANDIGETFKCPPTIEYKKPTQDDTQANNIEENVIQLDLQKSTYNVCASPTKGRQRIKATPIFGTRRNSFVGSTSPFHNMDDEQRTSVNSTNTANLHTKPPLPGVGRIRTESGGAIARIRTESGGFGRVRTESGSGGYGRIRTESGCSQFSDSYARESPKHRRTGGGHDEHRAITKREFQLKFNGNVPEKSSLKMFDLIYYNPITNPMVSNPPPTLPTEKPAAPPPQPTTNGEGGGGDSAAATPILVPQLKLGLNGEMMIDEKSLEIETTAEKEARKVLANTSLIVLDENSGNNGFYKRQKRTREWPPEETIKFYKCLHTVGTDFSLMLSLFPKRTRRELKLKFKKEEKCNSNLINKALLFPKSFNIEELQNQLDRDEQERLEKEAKWKEIQSRQGVRGTDKVCVASKAARCLKGGDAAYQNEFVPKKNLGARNLKKSTTVPKQRRTTKPKLEFDEQKDFDMLVNEDDGDYDIASSSKMTRSVIESMNSDTVDSVFSHSTDVHNIESVLTAINNNLLAIVATDEPENGGNTTYEIYALNRETRELEPTPLSLPEDIVNLIVSAMGT